MKSVPKKRKTVTNEQVSRFETPAKEVRIGISVEAYSKLTRRALAEGKSAEELVAQVISELSKNNK